MLIELRDVGKRFNREWIFRHLDATFRSGSSYAVVGPNGSGKSTLLQLVAGATLVSEGAVTYSLSGSNVEPDSFYRYVNMAAPYLELIEDFTLSELVEFHVQFKPLSAHQNVSEFIHEIGLEASAHKFVRNFSSGMKQRVKLGLCFFTQASLLILDEPTANLDATGQAWYQQLVERFAHDKILIVGSNDPQEYRFCTEVIDIQKFKLTN